MIRFACPVCKKVYKAKMCMEGKQSICKQCSSIVIIPHAVSQSACQGIPLPSPEGTKASAQSEDLSVQANECNQEDISYSTDRDDLDIEYQLRDRRRLNTRGRNRARMSILLGIGIVGALTVVLWACFKPTARHAPEAQPFKAFDNDAPKPADISCDSLDSIVSVLKDKEVVASVAQYQDDFRGAMGCDAIFILKPLKAKFGYCWLLQFRSDADIEPFTQWISNLPPTDQFTTRTIREMVLDVPPGHFRCGKFLVMSQDFQFLKLIKASLQ